MRQIGAYDYEGLCRAFINSPNQSAKTAQDRMSFYNDNIYSYDSHLATIDRENKVLLIDKGISNYSNTSLKHTNKLLHAHHGTVYFVNLDDLKGQTPTDMWNLTLHWLKKPKRARKHGDMYKENCLHTYRQTIRYLDYIKIDKRTSVYKRKNKVFLELFKAGLLEK